jgi:PAS domain S-box-containing protein
MGVWDWDVVTGELAWDEQIARLHGFEPEEFDGTVATFLSRIHPDDQAAVANEIQEALARGGPFLTEFRVRRPDGTTAWIQGRGRAVLDADGLPVRMVGVGSDTTQLRTTREQLGRTLEHISDGVIFLDRAWKVVYANARAARLLDRPVDDLVGRTVRERFPEVVRRELWHGFREAVRTRETQVFEAYYGPVDGWFEVRVFPEPSGITVYFQDVNERRARSAAQQSLVDQLGRALRSQADTQALIAALAEALTVEDVATVVLEQAREALGAAFAVVALLEEDGRALRFVPPEPMPAAAFGGWGRVPMRASTAVTDAVRFRRSVVHSSRAALLAEYPQVGEVLSLDRVEAFVSAPLVSGRRVVGALSMAWSEARTFDDDDQAFVRAMASQCALALERAQLFSRQANVADTLQRAMLPEELPLVEGLDVSACYMPATTDLAIGGDWYDAFPLDDGRIALAVGDVSGHGLLAATIMGRIRNGLRAYLIDDDSPAASLTKLDALADLEGRGLFATAIVGLYDPASGELVWANAGHPPPLHVAGGEATYLRGHVGAPVGVVGPEGHRDERLVIEPGEVLIAFTDGLVERRRENLDDGFARLASAVLDPDLDLIGAGCEAIVHHVTEGGSRADDVCVLMVRRRPIPAGADGGVQAGVGGGV